MRKKKKEHIDSFIGKDACFEGKLSFGGTVRIDGSFIGEIEATGNLVIGIEGRVDADIQAASIICNGEINGKAIAEQFIDIRTPGKMFGDIQAPTVVIQEGVVFKGNCRTGMSKEAERDTPAKVRQMKTPPSKPAVGQKADTVKEGASEDPKKTIVLK